MRRAFAALLFPTVFPALAEAQSVRGVVSDRNTSAPLAGVVVLLLDASGVAVGRALSNERGEYRVGALRPGAHRLRALRIGFLPVVTPPFTLQPGAELDRPLVLAGIPVALDTVRVTSRGRCDVIPDSARATFRVWEQVRAALTAAEITGRARAVGARIITFERTLDPAGDQVLRQTVWVKEGLTQRAWTARSQDSLRRFGYVHGNPDGSTSYFAPDLPALLSDAFLEDHCLRLSSQSSASRLGIDFEPIRARRAIPEIAGTVWLDRRTAELREMRFRYVNVARNQSAANAGGEMRFVRLRSGAWMIAGWHIRMPVIESRLVKRALDGVSEMQVIVREVRVEGGDLVLVTRGRDTLWSQPPLALRGMVSDSATGAPWVSARVAIRGTTLATRTDSSGRFTIAQLIPGEYVVEIASPELEAAGISRQVIVMLADSAVVLNARLADRTGLARADFAVSADTSTLARTAMLTGRVTSARDGRPLREVVIRVPALDRAAMTNANGAFRLTGIPPGTHEIRITRAGYVTRIATIAFGAGQVIDYTMVLNPTR